MGKKRVYWIPVVLMLLVVQTGFGANPNLIGHWKFDDGAGTTAVDSSGGGYDGTLTNAAGMTWGAGMLKGALNFDGTGYVTVPAGMWGSVRTQATIAFWSFGNPGLPNNWVFFAGNAAEQRLFSCHIPWDGSVYFDTATGWERINKAAATNEYQGQWRHWTFVKNADTGQKKIYLDGQLWHSGSGFTAVIEGVTVFRIGAGDSGNARYTGLIDDFQLYNIELTEAQIRSAMRGISADLAADPIPEDGRSDVPRDAVLSWTAAEFAATHDVYLGTVFDDVNDAGASDPRGVLVSPGQADTVYDPNDLLEYGRTYYWRIDEVNAAPDNTVFKGKTWSFQAEPFAYPVTPVAATASGSGVNMGPENAINGSGLNADDQHSSESTQMWMSNGVKPAWIQFEFGKVYKLDHMLVWNSNQLIETFLGFGARSVTIEYSEDGVTWATLEGVPEFAKATGTPTYTANTDVDFAGVMAKFVKLTINTNWGGVAPQTGLSEVRFFYVPLRAFGPGPAVGATGVDINAELSWRPGREATSHVVYVGADGNAVTEGTVAAETVTDHRYTPPVMNLGTAYYWRVDEKGEAGTYAGDVWGFTTQGFLAIDDFESYTDDMDAEEAIWQTWIDGLTDGKSGSQVGYNASPFAETAIVHSGKQSMPLTYDNATFAFSEATRTFDPPQNWTTRGIRTLAVYFRGTEGNGGQLYLKIGNTKVAYDGEAGDIAKAQWQQWLVDLSAISGLASVKAITIGVEGSGAAGKLYIDDIRVYPNAIEFATPVQPDSAGLLLQYTFDQGSGTSVTDASGNNNAGTINGTARWVQGVSGTALEFDGATNYVSTGKSLLNDRAAFTIACWLRGDLSLANRSGLIGQNDCMEYGVVSSNTIQIWTAGGGSADLSWPYTSTEEWHHVTAVGDGSSILFYLDGRPVVSGGVVTQSYGASSYFVNVGGGGIFDATGNSFNGQIDEVYVYQRALSAMEIAWLAGRTAPMAKPL